MEEKCILDPMRDCLGLLKAQHLEKEMTEWRHKTSEAHSEFYRRLNGLENDRTRIMAQYDHILATLTELKADIALLKEKPGKRWEGIVDKAIWAVAAAVIAYLLAGGRI